ncbi:hypothetical protein [Mycolicibacterium vanbaalenii]|nr:hypothetical protein [Mycolicibacterium vanbaalenii]
MSDLSTASDTFGDQPVQALNEPAESLVVGASGRWAAPPLKAWSGRDEV